MEPPSSDRLTYAEALAWSRDHALRLSEVPVEHAISLPLPTRRYGTPGFTQFAAPARRSPGQPTLQSPPDRWWIFAAEGGRLMAYALTAVFPVPGQDGFADVEANPPSPSVAALRAALDAFAADMEPAVVDFFDGRPAADADRLLHGLATLVPPAVAPQYEALAPDFFQWLRA